MSTEFQNLVQAGRPKHEGERTFHITVRCLETKQVWEVGHVAKAKSLYENPSEFRVRMLTALDKILQKYLTSLPVVEEEAG